MTLRAADILRYTTISDSGVPRDVFKAQLAALAVSERSVVPLESLIDRTAPEGAVCLTFDGGYRDFLDVAWPLLAEKEYPVVLTLPTEKIGGHADWDGGSGAPLLDWDDVKTIAASGVTLGVNGRTHRALPRLAEAQRDSEVLDARRDLEKATGIAANIFAAPYGQTDFMTLRTIVSVYTANLGTRLASVNAKSQLADLPRLDMTTFTDPARWQDHLAGRGRFHLNRQALARRIFGS